MSSVAEISTISLFSIPRTKGALLLGVLKKTELLYFTLNILCLSLRKKTSVLHTSPHINHTAILETK